MEAPPQDIASEEITYLDRLPVKLRMEVAQYVCKGREFPNIQGLGRALAVSSKGMPAKVVLKMLEKLPYAANVLDVADHLQGTPLLQDKELAAWIDSKRLALKRNLALYKASAAETDELLKDKNIELNLNIVHEFSISFEKGNRIKERAVIDEDSPLIHATLSGDEKRVESLLRAGANPDLYEASRSNTIKYPKFNPLSYSILIRPNINIMRMLIAAGALVNQTNANQSTILLSPPLYKLDCCPDPFITELIAAGANVYACDARGRNALHFAKSRSTIQLLIKAGVSHQEREDERYKAEKKATNRLWEKMFLVS